MGEGIIMDKPMYCPMSFNGCISSQVPTRPCTPNCAWSVTDGHVYWCGILTQLNKKPIIEVNVRPIKDGE